MWCCGVRRERRRWCVVWAIMSILACPTPTATAHGPLPTTVSDSEKHDDWGTLVAVTAVRGTTAKLPCSIHSSNPEDPVLLVLWYRNASVTPVYSYDSRGLKGKTGVAGGDQQQWGDEEAWGPEQRVWFDISTTPANLLVRDVRGRDEGGYKCKVHFRASPSWSQRITLSVQDPPGFPRIQDESGRRLEGPIGPYEDGSTVAMMCLASGEPPPGLMWGGSLVPEVGGSSEVEREGPTARILLQVEAFRATSGSTITCSTTNTSTSPPTIINTVSATLTVNLPPVSVKLEDPGQWVSGGQQTSFRCSVKGAFPRPVVQWWLGNRQLLPVAQLTAVGRKEFVSTLDLILQPGDHGATLMCKAYSPNLPAAALHDQLTLAVHFVPVARVSMSGGDGGEATVSEGGSVTFTCHLKANPSVYNVTWFYNGRPVRREESDAQISNTTLRLRNVKADQRGLYTCLASNQEGDGHSNALNLHVKFSPVCHEGQQHEYVVARGGSATVACSVLAYPTVLTFTWALKRTAESEPVRLESVGREEGVTGRYTLGRVEDERSEVWCWAKNSVGSQAVPCKFTIYTQGRPGPVSGCKVGNHTASGFTVGCLSGHPAGTSIWYTVLVYVQHKQEEGSSRRGSGSSSSDKDHESEDGRMVVHTLGQLVQNLTSASPFFVLRGLQAGQEFALVVRVSNSEGHSPPVVLSAFTLNDNAQTVIRMPTGGRHTVSGEGGGSEVQESEEGSGGGEAGAAAVPLVMIVAAASLLAGVLALVALLGILLVRRQSNIRRRERQEDQVLSVSGSQVVLSISGSQVMLSNERPLEQVATPDTTSQLTTGFQNLHVDFASAAEPLACHSEVILDPQRYTTAAAASHYSPRLS